MRNYLREKKKTARISSDVPDILAGDSILDVWFQMARESVYMLVALYGD